MHGTVPYSINVGLGTGGGRISPPQVLDALTRFHDVINYTVLVSNTLKFLLASSTLALYTYLVQHVKKKIAFLNSLFLSSTAVTENLLLVANNGCLRA